MYMTEWSNALISKSNNYHPKIVISFYHQKFLSIPFILYDSINICK